MNDTTPKPEALSRTWRLEVAHKLDGVVLSVHTYEVTIFRAHVGGEVLATIDGQPAELKQALYLIRDARQEELVAEVLAPLPEPARTTTIGKKEARTMHVELAHLGFADHYAAAADALGRPVTSLAALTVAEAQTVYSYAYGQWGAA